MVSAPRELEQFSSLHVETLLMVSTRVYCSIFVRLVSYKSSSLVFSPVALQ